MTRRQWSLVVLMILVNYLIFSQLFNRIVNTPPTVSGMTRTPEPTFTPTLALNAPLVIPPTLTPTPGIPTPTSTRVIFSDEQAKAATATVSAQATQQAREAQPAPGGGEPTAAPAAPTPENTGPSVTPSGSPVNLRTGPGLNYDRVGVLQVGQSLEIVGRNANSSWWQVATSNGLRWIAASVTTATNVDSSIPVVAAPPPPTSRPPTNTPPPPAPAQPPAPQQQYTIRNIFGQVNEAITQVRGDIRDGNNNPVNGVRVRVRSGAFCTVSYPSGPPGGYPAGGYDVLLDGRAKNGQWQVAVVNGPADPKDTSCNDGLAVLSEEVTVPTTPLEGVVFVEWRKNF